MADGILRIEDNKLLFEPNIFPSTQIKKYGFVWGGSDRRVWIGPINRSSIEGVKELFPNSIIDPTVTLWEKAYNSPIQIPLSIEQSLAKDFQKEPAAVLIRRKRAMLALAPGLGKSFCSILAAEAIPEAKRILVISPLSLVRNWRNEIEKWSGNTAVIWHGNKIEKATKWVVTNYDSVVRDLKFYCAQNFDIIIVDESVLVKNRKAIRTQRIKAVCHDAKYVWLLSGSPTTKFYDDMWSQLNILDSKRFSSYWKFAEQYCVLEKNPWGTAIINNVPNADLLLKKNISDIYYARTQDQVINLPPWLFDNIEISMSNTQYKLYDEMEKTFKAMLPSGDEVIAPVILTQLLRLIQFASNPILVGGNDDSTKWDSVEELLEFEKLPAIIWTSFKATAHAMESRLGKKFRVATLTGDTKDEDRQQIVDAYQHGSLDIIIAHPAVGKFGFTLTACRTAIYLERSYNSDDYYQSLHRIRRIGTTLSPHVIHLIATRPNGHKGNTVDHVIDRVLEFRRESAISLTSGEITRLFAA